MTSCIVVSGLPCAGKSTLATALAQHHGWPLLSKDTYKERIFEHLGASDRAWSRRVSVLAWEQLLAEAATLLGLGQSCILEGNFRAAQATRVQALASRHATRALEVQCIATPAVLLARYRARAVDGSRHPGHVDLEALPDLEHELARAPVAVLAAGELRIVCDTSEGLDARAVFTALAALLRVTPRD